MINLALAKLSKLIHEFEASVPPTLPKLMELVELFKEFHQLKLDMLKQDDEEFLDNKHKELDQLELAKSALFSLFNNIINQKDHPLQEALLKRLEDFALLEKPYLYKLALHKDIAIAARFIKNHPNMEEADLAYILQNGKNGHLFSICERKEIPQKILTLLVDEGEPMIMIALLCNPKVDFTLKMVQSMYSRHGKNKYFQDAINAREKASRDLNFKAILDQIRNGYLKEIPSDIDPIIVQKFFEKRLMPERALAAAVLGDEAALIQLFALYGMIPVKNVKSLLYEDKKGLKLLYSCAGFDNSFFELFKAAWIYGWAHPGPKGRDEQRAYLFERLKILMDDAPALVRKHSLKGSTDLYSRFNKLCKSPALRHLISVS